jgi:putative restriction endonuclease
MAVGRNPPYRAEEEVLIIDLYTRTPHSEIRDGNPDIIGLAEYISEHSGVRRSPSGVRYKMENLKSVDETYRGKGLVNISPRFRDMWYRHLEEGFSGLDEEVRRAKLILEGGPDIPVEEGEFDLEGRATRRFVEVRANQHVFRERVLCAYGGACCITGVRIPELLRASHIRPWRDCDGRQRLDVRNGLCLNALHDAAFDTGLMGIDEDLRVMFSPRIADAYSREAASALFAPYEGRSIEGTSEVPAGEDYLEYHRKTLFLRS